MYSIFELTKFIIVNFIMFIIIVSTWIEVCKKVRLKELSLFRQETLNSCHLSAVIITWQITRRCLADFKRKIFMEPNID